MRSVGCRVPKGVFLLGRQNSPAAVAGRSLSDRLILSNNSSNDSNPNSFETSSTLSGGSSYQARRARPRRFKLCLALFVYETDASKATEFE